MLPVYLTRQDTYDPDRLLPAARELLAAVYGSDLAGKRVLVKPNLVSPRNAGLACTHPQVVRAVSLALLERGARVTVGDSPALGSARVVGRAAGINQALADLLATGKVRLASLGRPEPLELSFGACVGLSQDAREADIIVNLPRLKAHGQMRLTLAVKNLFGCVVGWRKPMAHARFGECGPGGEHFPAMICEVAQALPRSVHVVDGITAMHVTGPTGGQPFPLGLLAAGGNPFAVDTAIYRMLGMEPDDAPLWRYARSRGLAGSDPAELTFPWLAPQEFPVEGFRLPERLEQVSFHPLRIVRGRVRDVCARLGDATRNDR